MKICYYYRINDDSGYVRWVSSQRLSLRGEPRWPQRGLWRRWRVPVQLSCPHTYQYPCGHKGLPKVVVIIIKTIIGAHIVLIPYTASQLGWVLFSIVLISIIGIHHFTTILLLRCKNWSRHSNFYTIMYHCWPYVGSKLFGTLLMALNNLAFCTSGAI